MKLSRLLLLFSDAIFFYSCLAILLYIRYGNGLYGEWWLKLCPIFTFVLIIWLLVIYSAGFYGSTKIINKYLFLTDCVKVSLINLVFSIIFFYFLGRDIAPKRLLVALVLIYLIVFYFSRLFYSFISINSRGKTQLYFVGNEKNYQRLKSIIIEKEPECELIKINFNDLDNNSVYPRLYTNQTFIYDNETANNQKAIIGLFRNNYMNSKLISLNNFLENIEGKLFVSNVNELWFIENTPSEDRFIYRLSKSILDYSLSLFLLIIFLPLLPLIIIAILIDSGTPIFFRQVRVGNNGKEFNAYKFRSMKHDGSGNEYWTTENDPRITRTGKFLRRTHIDEIPQLINVMIGNMSLVGPRPEQSKYVKELQRQIPFYELRHLVKPGITGWAQINFKYANSTESSLEKFEYELYYLKNRSLSLDLQILVKTFYKALKPSGE